MSISLQDQLKKSGLVDEKKAKQLRRAKNKAQKLARSENNADTDPQKLALGKLKLEKIERAEKDRILNKKKNAVAEKKALAAQIKQLVAMNAIANEGDQKFSFSEDGKIKHIWVSQTQIDQLSHGTIAIISQRISQKGQQHTLVPMGVAEKIEQRDQSVVAFKAEHSTDKEEDDPYADYQIPDDLTW